MRNKRTIIIGSVIIVLIIAFALRNYISLLATLLFSILISVLPSILLFGLFIAIGYFAYKYITNNKNRAIASEINSQVNTNNRIKELSEDLATAFKRNNARKLQHSLAKLPPWPITHHIQQTAQELSELKRSVYRAQAEGVPQSMIDRYLQNMNQAAETVWQLASNVDAVGLQQVSYLVVAPRLQQEEMKLQQLQQAIKASHEGIALLILSGTKSNILQDVEDDLRALTQAVKSLESAHTDESIPKES